MRPAEQRDTDKLWPGLRSPVNTCGHPEVVCYDHTEDRVWRYLDAFGKRTELLSAPPRARCKACRHVWRVPVP